MQCRKSSFLCWCVTLFFLMYLSDYSARGQTSKQPDDNPTIQSLLNEVRLLRKTLQRTGLNAYRSQIIIERMRAQGEQVVRLTRMLEDIRADIEKVESTIPRMLEQGRLLDNRAEQEIDANNRAEFEFESKEIKRAVERYKIGLERQKEREMQIVTQLRAEQTKLSELESRLDTLEREIENEIERQRSEDSSSEGKKRL